MLLSGKGDLRSGGSSRSTVTVPRIGRRARVRWVRKRLESLRQDLLVDRQNAELQPARIIISLRTTQRV